MPGPSRTFSDHWHRINKLRLALRPNLHVQRQVFRGETWYVVRDPMNDSYFRLRPDAYAFAARLSPDRTVEEVWDELLEADPEHALGQQDVLQLLNQLHGANLLYYRGSVDTAKIFERVDRVEREKVKNRLMNILYPHIPLFDPDRFLKAGRPFIRAMLSPAGWALWLFVIGLGLKACIENASELWASTEGVLAPSNWWALFVGTLIVKTVHEAGHALVTAYYGGEVHTVGVMMMLFTPMPYVDATAAWSFRSRWHRALVGMAGMLFEFFVAAIAALVWKNTAQGVVHSVAYNMMWVASVTSLFFNLNPLVRFDGYYILSDVLDVPNLAQRAQRVFHYALERYLLGNHHLHNPEEKPGESVLLFGYAVLSGIYRMMMGFSIMLYVGGKYLILGALIAAFAAVSWLVLPVFKSVRFLLTAPSLSRVRMRAIAVSFILFAGAVSLMALVPAPRRFRAPGVLEATRQAQVVTDAPGTVIRFTPSGTRVKAGEQLAELKNPEIDQDLEMARAQLEEIGAIEQKANVQSLADLEPLRQRRKAIETMMDNLREQKAGLVVKARFDGVWVVPHGTSLQNSYLKRGDKLGMIIDPASYRFTAVVSQEEAAELFGEAIGKVELRLFAQEDGEIAVKSYRIIPFQQRELPSAALGWRGGGEIAVSNNDRTGTQTTEGFFEIEAQIDIPAQIKALHGRSGQLRLSLTSEPLLIQAGRKVRQLLQRRYQI